MSTPQPTDERSGVGADDVIAAVRTLVGTMIVIVGLVLAFWLVSLIVEVLTSAEVPAIVARVTPEADPVIGMVEAGGFTLPAELMSLLGYLVMCLMMAIVAALATAMIRWGVALMQPDMKRVIETLTQRHSVTLTRDTPVGARGQSRRASSGLDRGER